MNSPPQFSFVIPARDEELLLEETIQSIGNAVRECHVTSELIVVDDASQDRTVEIAQACGAKVVSVELHNIGAVRNAGAAEAAGEVLFFLDADTKLPVTVLNDVIRALEEGAIGGGAAVAFDAGVTPFQRLLSKMFCYYWQRIGGWAAGCCIYVKRSTFESIGGFDPQHFAAEEKYISEAIRKAGRFKIVSSAVITSGRKLRIYSLWKLLKLALKGIFIKRWKFDSQEGLEILYDAPREKKVK